MILVSEENTEPEVSPEDVSLEDETEETVQTATSERDFADALVGSEPRATRQTGSLWIAGMRSGDLAAGSRDGACGYS